MVERPLSQAQIAKQIRHLQEKGSKALENNKWSDAAKYAEMIVILKRRKAVR